MSAFNVISCVKIDFLRFFVQKAKSLNSPTELNLILTIAQDDHDLRHIIRIRLLVQNHILLQWTNGLIAGYESYSHAQNETKATASGVSQNFISML